MDVTEVIRIREDARNKIVKSLSDILNATDFGSGFTDAEIMAQIRKEKPKLKIILALAAL